jgi:hypothetical protein
MALMNWEYRKRKKFWDKVKFFVLVITLSVIIYFIHSVTEGLGK